MEKVGLIFIAHTPRRHCKVPNFGSGDTAPHMGLQAIDYSLASMGQYDLVIIWVKSLFWHGNQTTVENSTLLSSECFCLSSKDSGTDVYEVQRAQEINQIYGPKGSSQAYDFMFDLHNTTSNMGSCLIVKSEHSLLPMHMCNYIQVRPCCRDFLGVKNFYGSQGNEAHLLLKGFLFCSSLHRNITQ